MKYFFIDTENVQKYDFLDNLEIDTNDKIVMFVSEKAQRLSIKDLKRFTDCNAKITYEDIFTGQNNALDFQLIANISLTIATENNKNIEYYIISNDNDFKIPIQYLINKTDANIQILKPNTNEISMTLDDIYYEFNLDKRVMDVIENSENLSQLHNNLKYLLGDKKGKDLYIKLKSKFKAIS